jgi:DNA-binding FadR family transcriptional regulator
MSQIALGVRPDRGRGTSRADILARELEAAIKRNGLEPGTRLGTKQDVRRQTGLSVATVNEAVRLLAARGLIVVRPGVGGGMFVAEQPVAIRLGNTLLALTDGDGTSVHDASVVRDALEPFVIDDVSQNRSDHHLAELSRLLAEMRRAIDDPAAFIDANWRLHSAMADMCANRLLATIYQGLLETIRRMTAARVLLPAPASVRQKRLQIHADIVDAIAAQDRDAAADAARRHHIIAIPQGPDPVMTAGD